MDAIQLLKADHQKVKDLLAELAQTTSRAVKKRTELISQIRVNLKAHTTIEEEIFYPAFKQAGEKEEAKMYYEALEEHRAAGDLVLPDLLNTATDSEQFSGRAKVLKELVEHHVKEEEEQMFKDAKKLMSSLTLVYVPELTLKVYDPGKRFEGVSKRRVQGIFSLGDAEYAMRITDPIIEKRYFAEKDGDYELGECLLTISLGEPYNDYVYKLIAAVITL